MNSDTVKSVKVEFDSSAISSAEYYPKAQHLVVSFNRGAIYSYDAVDSTTFENWLDSPSAGSYFHSNIRMEYDYHKLTPEVKKKGFMKSVLDFLHIGKHHDQ